MVEEAKPIDPWQEAHAQYMKDLNAEEQALFKTATLHNLLDSTQMAQKQHQDESRSRRIFKKLEPFIDAIDQYGKALDIYINTYSLAMAPLWGSVRVILHIANAFGNYFEKIIHMLARIGDILPRCQVYQTLFSTNERLLQAISMVYWNVIDFCWTAKHIFRKMEKSTIRVARKLLWKDLNKEFEEKLDGFRTCVKIVEKEAGISNMIEASEGWALVQLKQKVDSRQRLLSRLSSINYINKHLKEREKRHRESGSWLKKTVGFEEWASRTRSDCLWCYGIPGSGKTVLMSYLVDELSKEAVKKGLVIQTPSSQDVIQKHIRRFETTIVYYYCDSSDLRTLKLSNILGAIIRQLLEKVMISETLEKQIETYFRPEIRAATEEELFKILLGALQNYSNVYILMDGLDECNKEDLNKIMSMLRQLLRSERPLLKIALFSREENSIANALEGYPRVRVSSDKISPDINSFIEETVKAAIRGRKMCVSEPLLEREVISALINGAQGMFLWVHFQLLDLCGASSEFEVRNILKTLPQGMTATYAKILEKIAANQTNASLAQQMFKWIVCAKRPMLLSELSEAVAFKATDTAWNKEKVVDHERLYQAGGNLVVIDEKDKTVRLAHHTVQQFLLSRPDHQLARSTPFHFALQEADLKAGEICVAYLSFSDFERQISIVKPHNAMQVISLPLPAAILGRTTSKVGLNFAVSRLFNFAHYLRTGHYSEEIISIDFSKFAKLKTSPTPQLQEKYRFLNYAIENWIGHTSNLSEQDTKTWRSFEKLAINKSLPFDIRPWANVNGSNASTFDALLRWASNAEHIPLMKLVPRSYFIENQTLRDRLLNTAQMGKVAMIDILLMKGVDIEARDDLDDRTALILAVMEGHADAVELLLVKGANPNAQDAYRRTALHEAVINKDATLVKVLLDQRVDSNAKDTRGNTALQEATSNYALKIIELLLDGGVDPNAKDSHERTALHWASTTGDATTVNMLLNMGANPNARNSNQQTALHLATMNQAANIVEILLNHDADPNVQDLKGRTALHEATRNEDTDIVKMLLSGGADPFVIDTDQQTALRWRAINKDVGVVDLLLKEGTYLNKRDSDGEMVFYWRGDAHSIMHLLAMEVDPNAKDFEGRTALHAAVFHGATNVVELLLIQGVDLNAKDKGGKTALHEAVLYRREVIVKMLRSRGADINAKDNNGRTVLHTAVIHAQDFLHLLLLLNEGVDLNAKDYDGKTVLHTAVIHNKTRTIHLLLNEGVDLNAKDIRGDTALHEAVFNRRQEIVKMLLSRGADINAKDNGGRTVLHRAVFQNATNVIHLLLNEGADLNAQDNDGNTALDRAHFYEREEIIKMLMIKKAEPRTFFLPNGK